MKKFVCLLWFFCISSLSFGLTYVQVVSTSSVILVNPFENSTPLYRTSRGNSFALLGAKSNFMQIQLPASESGWISKQDVTLNVTKKRLPSPIVEPIQPVASSPSVYTQGGQENYRFPRRDASQHYDLNIDGFYEIKASGRDYSPRDVDDPLWETIINDEAYKKIPRDVLLGPMQVDFRSKVSIEGRLSEDLYVYYDIEQEPDMPSKYDVRIKYKEHDLQFFHLNSSYTQGDFINVKKSLRGAQYKLNNKDKFFQVSMGKERSDSQVVSNFGTGTKTIKLSRQFIYPGSVRVFVNNVQKKESVDYSVDYYSGEVTFTSPPQKSDYYKIIFESSNPIADYLPILSRRNFLGTQFSLAAKSDITSSLESIAVSETFSPPTLNAVPTDVSFNMSYFSSIPSLNMPLFLDLRDFLYKKSIFTATYTLTPAYTPTFNLTPLFITSSFVSSSVQIKDALDLFYFDTIQHRQSALDRFSTVQVFPDSFSSLGSLNLQQSTLLFYDLIANKLLNSQGYIHTQISSRTSLFPPESAFFSFNDLILTYLKRRLIEKSSHLQSVFILRHSPLALGSEVVSVNDVRLSASVDYLMDPSLGVVKLLFPLSSSDTISISYHYYKTSMHSEDLLGSNSVGPYLLSFSPILSNSFELQVNNTPLTEIRDYIVDYDSGELYFNFEIPYPDLISAQYRYIQSSVVTVNSKKRPFDVSATYLREYTPADDERQVVLVSSENASISNNAIILTHSPLVNTENIRIILDGSSVSETNYSLSSEDIYKGLVTLGDSLTYSSDSSVVISYAYQKSYKSKFVYLVGAAAGNQSIHNQNGDTFILRDLPIKYNGISYITLWDGVSEKYLENGNEFTVDYASDGSTFSLAFLKTTDLASSKLDTYPQAGNRITVIYEFTPEDSAQSSDIIHQVFGTTVTAHFSDSWSVNGELVFSGDNYSSQVLDGTLEPIAGTGQDNYFYSFGVSNLVEDSEQIFLNNISQTKDEDYFVNYNNGTFRFRNQTPQSNDEIRGSFQYYSSDKTLTSGETEYSYATKLSSSFTAPSFNISSSFKFIDRDFSPMGGIKDAKGNTIFDTSFGWTLSNTSAIKTSYSRQKIFQSTDKIDQDIFLHKDILNTEITNRLFNTIDASHKLEYRFDLKDPENTFDQDYTHGVDDLTYGYKGTFTFGPDYLKNTVIQNVSRQKFDIRDNLLPKDSVSKLSSYTSALSLSDFPLLNTVSLTPSYYNSYSYTTQSIAPSFSFNRHESYGFTSKVIPVSYWTINSNADFQKRSQSSSASELSLNESKKYSINSSYSPIAWLSTAISYSHDESLSPLNSQASDVSERYSYSVSRLSVLPALISVGFNKKKYIPSVFRSSTLSYFYSSSLGKSNNRRKLSRSNSNRWNLNSLTFLPTLTVKNLVYTKTKSTNDSYVPQSTVSENHSLSDQLSYGGSLLYRPKTMILKYFTYTYSLSESKGLSQTAVYARSTTGNIQEQNDFDRAVAHSLSYQSPQFSLLNPFNRSRRIRLGKGSATYARSLKKLTNRSFSHDLLYDDTLDVFEKQSIKSESLDNSFVDDLSVRGSVYPFNLIRFAGSYGLQNTYLNRNKYSSSGSTFQLKKNYGLSTGFSPLSFLSTTVSFAQNRHTQYTSPSINRSISELKSLYISQAPGFGGYLNNLSQTYSGSVTLSPFRFFSVTGTGSFSEIKEHSYTSSSASSSIFRSKTYTASSTLTPLKNLSVLFSFSLNRINDSEGQSNALSVSYDPVKRSYSSISIRYTRNQSVGKGFNQIQQDNSSQGSGDHIKTAVISRNDVTQKGSVNVSLTYPVQNAHIQKFVISSEGYLKRIDDLLESSNSYNISGLLFKGTLHF